MSEPFLSEIKVVSFNFAPKGWALCNGQTLPINQNQALFALLGTTYGGNGQTTFNLPNLRGQVPISFGSGHTLGEKAGSTSVTVNIQQLPTHVHAANASDANGSASNPNNAMLAASGSLWGFRRTIPHMLGVAIGFPLMLIAVAAGAGDLLVHHPAAVTVMRSCPEKEARAKFTDGTERFVGLGVATETVLSVMPSGKRTSSDPLQPVR